MQNDISPLMISTPSKASLFGAACSQPSSTFSAGRPKTVLVDLVV